MELSSIDFANCRVIRVEAERIDSAVAIHFKDQMRALSEGLAVRAILDLGQVTFIDSSGLGAIVAALKQMPAEVRLDLANLQDEVARVLRLTRMDRVFVIHDSVETAAHAH